MKTPSYLHVILLLVLGVCCTGCQPTSKKPAEIIQHTKPVSPAPSVTEKTPVTLSETPDHEDAAEPQKELIRIALLAPLSGPQAQEGAHMVNAAMMAIQDWKKPIKLYPINTQGTPEGVEHAYDRLHKLKVSAILGPLFSKEVKALASKPNLPPIIAFSNHPQESFPEPIFRLAAFPHDTVRTLVEWGSQQNFHTYALVVPTSAYGSYLETLVLEELQRAGHQCATIVRYDATMADGTIAEPLHLTPVDAWIITEMGPKADLLVKTLCGDEPKSHPPILSVGLGSEDTWGKTRTPMHVALPTGENFSSFRQRYQNLFRSSPSLVASWVYDAVSLVTLLKASHDIQAFADPQGFQGLQGTFRFVNQRSQRLLGVFRTSPQGLQAVSKAPKAF